MPADQGFRMNDHHRMNRHRPKAVKPHKPEAIDLGCVPPLARRSKKHIQLVTEHHVFGPNIGTRSQAGVKLKKNETNDTDHAASLAGETEMKIRESRF